jgi:uncharacterized surface protein with fasciclin (FAS1) repeats
MKHKISLMLLTLYLASSLVVAQVDQATGTLTNDTTQARLRLGHFVLVAPNVDFYVNGQIAVNGGQEQVNIPAGYANGYMFLDPGTYSIAVVPTGETIEAAVISLLEVELVKGHRYTLAMIEQAEDSSIKLLLIDETEAELGAGASPNDSVLITVNNLLGANTIDSKWDGQPLGESVPYGGFGAAVQSSGFHAFAVTATGTRKGRLIDDNASLNVPGKTSLQVYTGQWPYPGYWETITTPGTSNLNIIDFLQGFSQQDLNIAGAALSFDTFLAALETSGLSEQLATGTYFVLPPTDEAFAALPKDQLDALLADPKALDDVLRNHIIEAYVPRGSAAKTPGGTVDRSFTTLLGQPLHIGDGFIVNGTIVGDFPSFYVANGTQVHPITKVLLPPSQ